MPGLLPMQGRLGGSLCQTHQSPCGMCRGLGSHSAGQQAGSRHPWVPPHELHPYPCTQLARGCIGVGLPSSGSSLMVGDLMRSPSHQRAPRCAVLAVALPGVAGPAPGQVEAAVRAGDPCWLHTCLSS